MLFFVMHRGVANMRLRVDPYLATPARWFQTGGWQQKMALLAGALLLGLAGWSLWALMSHNRGEPHAVRANPVAEAVRPSLPSDAKATSSPPPNVTPRQNGNERPEKTVVPSAGRELPAATSAAQDPPPADEFNALPKPVLSDTSLPWAWPTRGTPTVERGGWSYDRADLELPADKMVEQMKKEGGMWHVKGWADYDFSIEKSGWYELRRTGDMSERPHDVFLDGQTELHLVCRSPEDIEPSKRPDGKGWYKEANFYLKQGKHTFRFRSLNFPSSLPSQWELGPADGEPSRCLRAVVAGPQVVHTAEPIKVVITGGTTAPTAYELLLRNEASGKLTPAGKVEFSAGAEPVEKTLSIALPAQGTYRLLATSGGYLLKPADLKAGAFVAVDAQSPPPAEELKTTPLIDIDCVAQTINGRPIAEGVFWEKDGQTQVIAASCGKYRQSSGMGTDKAWATDGFSYRFDLPDTSHIYRLRVEYPDDDRRTMGFWVNDGMSSPRFGGEINTGGVETGDHYPLSGRMQNHAAFFYPRGKEGLVVAVLNLVPGYKAAAARVWIDRVDSALPAGPQGKPGGRTMGFHFEEPGRWLKFFGAESTTDCNEHLRCMDRWGQWNRFLGANLFFPTIAIYQSFQYPCRIAEGYFGSPDDYVRMGALVAEKYGCRFIPEFEMGGQTWFDKRAMGVWSEAPGESAEKDKRNTQSVLRFASREAEEFVIRDRDGGGDLRYNALHPRVQAMYISILGELADRLGDCPAFDGISTRLMLEWQWQGWDALPGIDWGYDDWTVTQFQRDAAVRVPGRANDPQRFRQRFACLTGPLRDRWMAWRCSRLFDFHCRLRDRIRHAKPSANLYFHYFDSEHDSRLFVDQDLSGRLREIGIDLAKYAHEPGFVLLPGTTYGRRYSTPIRDAYARGFLYEGEGRNVAALERRACGLHTNYFEVNDHLDWAKLGGKPYSAFDTCAPVGVYERELYALALAECDASWLVNGGSGWMFGTPTLMQPWLREYRALPAAAFESFEKARDPVAVWYKQIDVPPAGSPPGPEPGFYFYAVNRLPRPLKVAILLTGATKVQSAVDGAPQNLAGGRELQFDLEPYMLRAFRAEAAHVTLDSCRVATPAEVADGMKPLMAFARGLLGALQARWVGVELSQSEAEQAITTLQQSLQAFDDGRYWTARTLLERMAMIRLYDIVGRYPPGLLQRSKRHGYVDAPQSPRVEAGPWSVLGDVRGRLSAITGLACDAEGNVWAASDEQLAQFNRQGRYVRSLQLLLPHRRDLGDARWIQLDSPQYVSPSDLCLIGDERIAVAQTRDLPLLYETQAGRLIRSLECFSATPRIPNPLSLLGADAQGDFYLACTAEGDSRGVYRYHRDGSLVVDAGGERSGARLSLLSAGGAAWDRRGRFYLSLSDGLHIYLPSGKETAVLAHPEARGLGKITVNAAGDQLFALASDGRSIQGLRFNKAGKFLGQGAQPLPVPATALALLPNGNLLVGFHQEIEGAVAREFVPRETGLQPRRDAVRGLRDIQTQCLRGYTQFKVHSGKIYFLAHNKLMFLAPGNSDRVEVLYDPGPVSHDIESFALAPSGDIYLASNWGLLKNSRGMNVYVCRRSGSGWGKMEMLNDGKPLFDDSGYDPSDLEVDRQGRLLLRLNDPEAKASSHDFVLFRYAADGTRTRLAALGSFGQAQRYGLYQAADGKLYVAAGETRSVWCLSANGETLWKTVFDPHQPPDCLPLRSPLGITTDSKGRVWITDPARNHVVCLDADGRFLKSYGHFGTIDDREGWSLCNPVGIAAALDGHGTEWLYLADVNNQRIVKWKIAAAP
jgi:hypothetical protein